MCCGPILEQLFPSISDFNFSSQQKTPIRLRVGVLKKFLVELEGFEPSTSSMPLKRSTN